MNRKSGVFIAFEGIDGSGKSTQLALLKNYLEAQGQACIVTREPSDGPVGSLLRQFLSGRIQGDEAMLCALFAADRLDHLNNPVTGIKKLLEDGCHVLSDRYLLSNYAYQSVTLPLDWIRQCNAMAVATQKPALHLFIDVSPDIALERIRQGRMQQELFETRERLTQVRNRYLSLIEEMSGEEQIVIIDGNRDKEQIAAEIYELVSDLLDNYTRDRK